jgi:hypothetical protein
MTIAMTHANATTFLHQSAAELDELFRGGSPAKIPVGKTEGTAIIAPGSFAAPLIKVLARALFWKGKLFRPDTKDLMNRLTPFGIPGIRAMVYQGESWFDRQQVIVIDYSKTSFLAKKIRDEIREVEPGLYLGKIWWGKTEIGYFALET